MHGGHRGAALARHPDFAYQLTGTDSLAPNLFV